MKGIQFFIEKELATELCNYVVAHEHDEDLPYKVKIFAMVLMDIFNDKEGEPV